MSRLRLPPDNENVPAAARPLLDEVNRRLGRTPNMFRLLASSPVALRAYLELAGTLRKGAIPPANAERIALAVAQVNDCGYCLAAHTAIAKGLAKLDDAEIAANREGHSHDPKADAAVRFAVEVAEKRGHVDDAAIAALKEAGYDDAATIELVLHVALNSFTNYINEVAQTDLDFPAAGPRP